MNKDKTRRRVQRQLDKYEPFIQNRARDSARNPDEIEDFAQEGRMAVVRAYESDPDQSKPTSYYTTAIKRAMIDYARKVYRANRAYVEDGKVKRLPYQPQGSADADFGSLLWGDAFSEN